MGPAEGEDDRRVRRWALGLAAAWGAGAGLFVALAGACQRMFREVGVNLPSSTECAFVVLDAMRHPPAYVALTALVVILLAPVATGASARTVTRWLRLGALQSLCLWGAGLAAIVHAVIDATTMTRCACHGRDGHVGDGRLVVALPLLAVGLAQLHTWYGLSRELLRVPRGRFGLELRRAALLALPFGVVAAGAAIKVTEAIPAGGAATLLVPPGLAASWTALFAAIGGGLLVRARTARPVAEVAS